MMALASTLGERLFFYYYIGKETRSYKALILSHSQSTAVVSYDRG